MPSFWNSLVLNGPVPALVWPIDLALSIACLKASAVLMSGFGAPALTATPLPTRAYSTTLPATTLPVFDEVVELTEGERGQVPCGAFVDFLVQVGSALEADVDLVSTRLLECGCELHDPRLRGLIE